MNVPLLALAPLPRVLNQSRQEGGGRRHHVGDCDIDREALRHFNELLGQLNLQQAPLDPDQMASAARELVDDARHGVAPSCIQQRMRRAAAVELMAGDPDWEVRYAAAIRAEMALVDYLRGSAPVIPNALPVVGRLDDAIVVEAAWPSLVDEVRDYLAFRRIRQVEARLRGETRPHFGFTREQWQAAARAEAEWIAHCERVDQQSYVARDSIGAFRVH